MREHPKVVIIHAGCDDLDNRVDVSQRTGNIRYTEIIVSKDGFFSRFGLMYHSFLDWSLFIPVVKYFKNFPMMVLKKEQKVLNF